MNNKILKIDLDAETMLDAFDILKERIAYIHDINIFNIDYIDEVILLNKTSYGCRIKLNKAMSEGMIIIFQLLLGSDWRKEANTYLNHFILDMNYSNRLFTSKSYVDGKLIHAIETEITQEIKEYVKSDKRKKNQN